MKEIYELAFLHYYIDDDFRKYPIEDTVTIKEVVSGYERTNVNKSYILNAVVNEMIFKLKQFIFKNAERETDV